MNEQNKSRSERFSDIFGDSEEDFSGFRYSDFNAEHTTHQIVIPAPFDDMGQDMVVTVDSKTGEIIPEVYEAEELEVQPEAKHKVGDTITVNGKSHVVSNVIWNVIEKEWFYTEAGNLKDRFFESDLD